MIQKLGKSQAILFVLIVTINKILLNIPKEIIKQSKTGAPINILFTLFLALMITLLICKLFKKFPNEDIIDISQYLGKKPLQIIIGSLFIILFSLTIITCIYEFSNLLQSIYFPNSPVYLILLAFFVSMGFANYKGSKSISKTNSIIVTLILISLIIILGGTISDYKINRLFPIFGESVENTFIMGSQNIFAYAGLLYLLFLKPFLKNKKDFTSIGIISVLISGLFLLFCAITLLALFPYMAESEELMSMYLLTRSIQFGEFLQRADAIFIFLWIISAFSYLSISLMLLSNIFKKMTNSETSKSFQYSFLGIFFATIILFENRTLFKFLETVVYKYFILGLILINIIILILANFKKKEI